MNTVDIDYRSRELKEFGQGVLQPQRKARRLKQTTLAAHLGEDQPYISKLESGKAVPKNSSDVYRIAKEYRLSEDQTNTWLALLFGTTSTTLPWNPSGIDLYQFAADAIYQARVQGNPGLTIDLAITARQHIERTIATTDQSSSEYKILQRLLARFVYEQLVAYTETKWPHELIPLVSKDAEILFAIAKDIKDAEIRGLGFQRIGAAYFIAKDHATAAPFLEKALQYLKDNNNRLWTLHSLVVNYGLMQAEEDFKRVEKLMRSLVERDESLRRELVSYAIERLGRAQGHLHKTEALSTLEKAQDLCDGLNKANSKYTLRRIQVIRSKLDVMVHLATREHRYAEEMASRGIILAEEAGYFRHADEIRTSANAILN